MKYVCGLAFLWFPKGLWDFSVGLFIITEDHKVLWQTHIYDIYTFH